MKFYRIKQIAKDSYIPQVKRGLLGSWYAIDLNNDLCWYTDEYQVKWCSVETYTEAITRIALYKQRLIEKKQYPRYYKIK